eukprot:4565535-Amphidinium_carterae.1
MGPWSARLNELQLVRAGNEAYSFPPAEARLGFTSLTREDVAHYLAQLLIIISARTLHTNGPLRSYKLFSAMIYPPPPPMRLAVLNSTLDVLAAKDRRKAMKLLRAYPLVQG